MTVMTVAGTALLISVAASLDTADDIVERTIALGMAQQLMDELSGMRYKEPGIDPRQVPLGPSSVEAAGVGRSRFNDIDDYNGVNTSPPTDRWAVALGTEDINRERRHTAFQVENAFAGWRQQVTVRYVNDANLAQPQSSPSWHRVAEVRIWKDLSEGGRRELARLSRVFSYVPEP